MEALLVGVSNCNRQQSNQYDSNNHAIQSVNAQLTSDRLARSPETMRGPSARGDDEHRPTASAAPLATWRRSPPSAAPHRAPGCWWPSGAEQRYVRNRGRVECVVPARSDLDEPECRCAARSYNGFMPRAASVPKRRATATPRRLGQHCQTGIPALDARRAERPPPLAPQSRRPQP